MSQKDKNQPVDPKESTQPEGATQEDAAETQSNEGEGAPKEGSIYKQMVTNSSDEPEAEKDVDVSKLMEELKAATSRLQKAEYTIEKLKKERKKFAEVFVDEDDDSEAGEDVAKSVQIDPDQIAEKVIGQITQQTRQSQLNTMLSAVEDPYKRKAIEMELQSIAIDDPKAAFDKAVAIVEYNAQLLASKKAEDISASPGTANGGDYSAQSNEDDTDAILKDAFGLTENK